MRSGVDSDWPQEEARRFHGSRTADDAIGGGEERDTFGDGCFGERLRGCGGGRCVDVLECDEAEVVERAAERGGELDCGTIAEDDWGAWLQHDEDFRWRRGHLPSFIISTHATSARSRSYLPLAECPLDYSPARAHRPHSAGPPR